MELLELPSDTEGPIFLEFEREMRRLLVETFCCQVYTPDVIERMGAAVLEMAVRELDDVSEPLARPVFAL